jgi:hypothetical protein
VEHRLWQAIVAVLATLDNPRTPARFAFPDAQVVGVYYWAVMCDRPTSWACRKEHWPVHRRKRPLPSPATMSRRLRSARVKALLDALERRVTAPAGPGLFWMVDGKPLPIGGCSKDKQAGYGRAAGGKAKGYKLHALVGTDGSVAGWRVAPMNTDERVMAERLLKAAPPKVLGYVVADANYDSNKLHRVCDAHGNRQPVTPRRYGPAKVTGHREQTPGRLRSIALTEGPFPAFADRLRLDRAEIERRFANGRTGAADWHAGRPGCEPTAGSAGGCRPSSLTRLKPTADIGTCAA